MSDRCSGSGRLRAAATTPTEVALWAGAGLAAAAIAWAAGAGAAPAALLAVVSVAAAAAAARLARRAMVPVDATAAEVQRGAVARRLALELSADRNRAVLDSLREGVIVVDGGGEVVLANPAAQLALRDA